MYVFLIICLKKGLLVWCLSAVIPVYLTGSAVFDVDWRVRIMVFMAKMESKK